jgi:starch synthase
MASGCLPLVHDVGGLHDTVRDMETGFVFGGADRSTKCTNLINTLDRALEVRRHPARWDAMRENACSARFDWERSADAYLELYRETTGDPDAGRHPD